MEACFKVRLRENPRLLVSFFSVIGNCDAISYYRKTFREAAQTAEMELIAAQTAEMELIAAQTAVALAFCKQNALFL